MSANIENFLVSIADKREKAVAAALKAVRDYGLQVLGDAQQLAPVGGGIYSPYDPAPGTLAASATHEGPTLDGSKINMQIGFNTVYAAAQHERLDYRHDQGQAKYLETPMNQRAPGFPDFMAKRIAEGVGS